MRLDFLCGHIDDYLPSNEGDLAVLRKVVRMHPVAEGVQNRARSRGWSTATSAIFDGIIFPADEGDFGVRVESCPNVPSARNEIQVAHRRGDGHGGVGPVESGERHEAVLRIVIVSQHCTSRCTHRRDAINVITD